MDAKITKQRLGNLLSYDWLKILAAIAAAVFALTVFFTMVRTRPTAAQRYSVYGYTGLKVGSDFLNLDSSVGGVFSYDILAVNTESFEGNSYQTMAFSARRAAGEGTVMFVSDYAADDGDETTVEKSPLQTLTEQYRSDFEGDKYDNTLLLDTKQYFSDAQSYLKTFFGENWREGTLDEARVRTAFDNRNGKDKRFRYKAEKYEAGVLQERERLLKLREDYLFVEDAVEKGVITHTEITFEDGQTFSSGLCLGKLSSIYNLLCYNANGMQTAEKLNLVIFNNGERLGDLKYETFSFLRYLITKYGG